MISSALAALAAIALQPVAMRIATTTPAPLDGVLALMSSPSPSPCIPDRARPWPGGAGTPVGRMVQTSSARLRTPGSPCAKPSLAYDRRMAEPDPAQAPEDIVTMEKIV